MADFEGDPFSMFHCKLKKVKKALTQWSKVTCGNIFQEIATLEEVIRVQETQFETNQQAATEKYFIKPKQN